jgi:hypothetical protein
MKSNSKGSKKEESEKAKSQGISKGRGRGLRSKSPKTPKSREADAAETAEEEEEEGTGTASDLGSESEKDQKGGSERGSAKKPTDDEMSQIVDEDIEEHKSESNPRTAQTSPAVKKAKFIKDSTEKKAKGEPERREIGEIREIGCSNSEGVVVKKISDNIMWHKDHHLQMYDLYMSNVGPHGNIRNPDWRYLENIPGAENVRKMPQKGHFLLPDRSHFFATNNELEDPAEF